MRIPVLQGFDPNKPIGYLELQDGLEIPVDAVFALTYTQAYKDRKPIGEIQVHSVSLVSDMEYLQFVIAELRNMMREKAKANDG